MDELLQATRLTSHRLVNLKSDNSDFFVNDRQVSSTKPDGKGGSQAQCAPNSRLHHLQSESLSDQAMRIAQFLMMGIDDAACTAQLIIQMQLHEADRQRTKLHLQRLSDENKWLRGELNRLRKRVNENEQEKARLEVELEHYKFQDDLSRKFAISSDDTLCDTTGSGGGNGAASENPNDYDFPLTGEAGLSTTGFDRSSSTATCNSLYSLNMSNSTTADAVANSGIVSSDTPSRLRTLHNLVVHYVSNGKYEVAVPLCRQTLEDLERTSGRDHPDVATMINILALVYRDQNKYKEAGALLRDALDIRERTLGPDHPIVAATLNNLAVLHGKLGKYKDAEKYCNRALKIREKVMGSDHPDVAKQLSNLALICLNQRKYEDTEKYYKRALQVYTERLGPADSNVLRTKISMASAHVRRGTNSSAHKLIVEVLQVVSECDDNFDRQIITLLSQTAVNMFKREGNTEMADKFERLDCTQISEMLALLTSKVTPAGNGAGNTGVDSATDDARRCSNSGDSPPPPSIG